MNYFFLFKIAGALAFKLKLKNTSLFISNIDDGAKMTEDVMKAVDIKQSQMNSSGFILTQNGTSKVFDINGGRPGGDMIFYSLHGGSNQRFVFVLNSDATGIMIKNGDACVEAIENNTLKRTSCDESNPKQLFVRVDSETNSEQPNKISEKSLNTNYKHENPSIILVNQQH